MAHSGQFLHYIDDRIFFALHEEWNISPCVNGCPHCQTDALSLDSPFWVKGWPPPITTYRQLSAVG